MTNYISRTSLAAGLLALAVITACTQMPTEKMGVSDLRPQISFRTDDAAGAARVLVDGLDMGAVSSYLEGTASLRILPGTHLLQVRSGGQLVFEEKFYAGDGVNRTFNVKRTTP